MRTKFELADAVNLFGADLYAKGKLTPLQLKVLGKIAHCRTAALGGHEEGVKAAVLSVTVTIAVATGTAPNARPLNRLSGLTTWCTAPCPLSITTLYLPCHTS